jgi:hypothetical protein
MDRMLLAVAYYTQVASGWSLIQQDKDSIFYLHFTQASTHCSPAKFHLSRTLCSNREILGSGNPVETIFDIHALMHISSGGEVP